MEKRTFKVEINDHDLIVLGHFFDALEDMNQRSIATSRRVGGRALTKLIEKREVPKKELVALIECIDAYCASVNRGIEMGIEVEPIILTTAMHIMDAGQHILNQVDFTLQ